MHAVRLRGRDAGRSAAVEGAPDQHQRRQQRPCRRRLAMSPSVACTIVSRPPEHRHRDGRGSGVQAVSDRVRKFRDGAAWHVDGGGGREIGDGDEMAGTVVSAWGGHELHPAGVAAVSQRRRAGSPRPGRC